MDPTAHAPPSYWLTVRTMYRPAGGAYVRLPFTFAALRRAPVALEVSIRRTWRTFKTGRV